MNTAYQTESEFYTREDGVMELSCRVELAIGYRVTIDGNTGKVGYQPFVGGYVSPLSFPTVAEAQVDIARLVSVQVRQLELAIPCEGATSDMEYHLSVIRALAGIEENDLSTEETGTVNDDQGARPFDCEEEEVVAVGKGEETECELLDNTYSTFSLRKYLERIEPVSLGFDEALRARYSCLCQLKGDVFMDLEADLIAELRLYHHDDAIFEHLSMEFNGGVVVQKRFMELVQRFLSLVVHVHFYGVTDPAHLLDE